MAKLLDETGAQWIINKAITSDEENLAAAKSYTDNAVINKADRSNSLSGYGIQNAYTKLEVDEKLKGLSDNIATEVSNRVEEIGAYSKTEVDSMLANKANTSDTLSGYGIKDAYTKSEADAKFLTASTVENKADKATTLGGYGIGDAYTKSEVDAKLSSKANKGTSLVEYGITNAYTKAEVDNLLVSTKSEIAQNIDSDVAEAINDAVSHMDTYTKSQTDTLLEQKASKSTTLIGYGITDAYTKDEVDNKLSDKADATSVYTKSEVDQKLAVIDGMVIETYPSRPAVGEENVLYLVPAEEPADDNLFDEWIWKDNKWEKFGSSTIALEEITPEEIEAMWNAALNSNDEEATD